MYLDNKLNFEYHHETLCKKASQKLHYIIIYEPFMTKKDNHECLYHSRKIHRQINKIHERALRIVHMGKLLEKSESVSIHNRNLQHLAIEIYKALHNLSSSLMSEIFRTKRSNYSFRNNAALVPNRPRPQVMELNAFHV